MSCITEILKKKGDQEFLSIPSKKQPEQDRGIVIEGGGHYKGYEYLITFNDMGFRCGYVAITQDHPDYSFNEEHRYPDYSVHGGVTFFDESHLAESILGHSCTDKWIGFDAGHAWDVHDIDCALKYFPNLRPTQRDHIETMNRIGRMDGSCVLRTKEYMEQECKNLIDQIIEKAA